MQRIIISLSNARVLGSVSRSDAQRVIAQHAKNGCADRGVGAESPHALR